MFDGYINIYDNFFRKSSLTFLSLHIIFYAKFIVKITCPTVQVLNLKKFYVPCIFVTIQSVLFKTYANSILMPAQTMFYKVHGCM